MAALADQSGGVVEGSGGTGAEVATVHGHQSRRNAVAALGVVRASITISVAGCAHHKGILVEAGLAGAGVAGQHPVLGGVAGRAVGSRPQTGQAAGVAPHAQLNRSGGGVVAGGAEAGFGAGLEYSEGGGVAGQTDVGGGTGQTGGVAGHAQFHPVVVILDLAGAEGRYGVGGSELGGVAYAAGGSVETVLAGVVASDAGLGNGIVVEPHIAETGGSGGSVVSADGAVGG